VVATSSEADKDAEDPHKLDGIRYERTSELIKAFKHSCARAREEFHSLEMELSEFTAVLDELTRNTYVLIIVHNPTIGRSFHALSYFIIPAPASCSFYIIRNRRVEDEYMSRQEEI